MGVDTTEDRLAANKGATPASSGPSLTDLAAGASSTVRDRSSTEAMNGPRGRDRLMAELAAGRAKNSDEVSYSKFVLSLKTDPADPEYSMALANEQNRAQEVVSGGAAGTRRAVDYKISSQLEGLEPESAEYDAKLLSLSTDWRDPLYSVTLLKLKSEAKARERLRMSPQDAADARAKEQQSVLAARYGEPDQPAVQAEYNKAAGAVQDRSGPRPEDKDATDEYRRRNTGKAIVLGMPVSAESILSEEAAPAGDATSEWVKQWANDQGLNLGYDATKQAVNSGFFVYVGSRDMPEGGPGFKRDVYVYQTDAKAMITGMSEETIADYQNQLGLDVTGIVDPKLQAFWEEAVEQAQQYARQGKKIDLMFLFNAKVAAQAAKGGLGGGGGGGGRAPMTDSDYYFAMMQVMGDIGQVRVNG